jgi:hypothetical protein
VAAAFVNSTTGSAAGVTSITINAPASIVSGNLLICHVLSAGQNGTFSSTGWTAVQPGTRTAVLWKTAGGSEPGSYTFTYTGPSTTMTGYIAQYSGVTTPEIVNVDAGVSATSSTFSSISPTGSNDQLLLSALIQSHTTVSTPPTGVVSRVSNAGVGAYLWDKTLSAAGATGTNTIALSASDLIWTAELAVTPSAITTVTGTATVTVGPLAVATGPGVLDACLRKAWLTLGDLDVSLEDPGQGYFCTQLDLGFPTPRDVMSSNPDRDGQTDRTQYLSSRVVTANITTLAGAGGRIDQVAAQFAPFMLPSNRAVLHYVLDRPGLPERTLTVRGSGYSWPISGPAQRDIQLQWVAADPVARDPTPKTATAFAVTPATLTPAGDIPVRPRFRISGPTTGPAVILTPAGGLSWYLAFQAGFTIALGHYVDIDTDARTVLADGDPAQPRLSSMDWTVSSWQWLPAGVATHMVLTGSATTGLTQVQAFWNDGYLT